MKIRSDFVTNSSSSSFVLAFEDEKDINRFQEDCNSYDYEAFYNLIDSLASDFLEFSNETRNQMPIRPLIDKLRSTYDVYWGTNASYELNRLYTENYQLKPWEMLTVKINSFGDKEVDLEELNFEEIEEEDSYTISIIDHKSNRNKKEALENLRWMCTCEYRQKLLDEKFQSKNYETYRECLSARNAYEETQEYKDLIEKYLASTDYSKKKEMIEQAALIVSGMIWDTSGGILEYAIRNGFIEREMYKYCVYVWNVG